MAKNITNYIDRVAYFSDLKIIDERLTNLEHNIDQITKNIVELLNRIEEKECGGKKD